MSKEYQILKTNDYDKFSFIESNRNLNSRNYAKLVKSIEKEQLIIPILVNEKYEIIDGQHRFTACKELNKPIYYYIVEGYTIEQVKRANMVNSIWKKEDYLHMHLEQGNDRYIQINDLISKYNIVISDMINIFATINKANNTLTSKDFEEGNFNIDNIDKVKEFLEALTDFKAFKHYNSKTFIRAFLRLYTNEKYEHSKMKERLEVRIGQLKKKSNIDEYLVLLTKNIYSFGGVKVPIFYDAATRKFYY